MREFLKERISSVIDLQKTRLSLKNLIARGRGRRYRIEGRSLSALLITRLWSSSYWKSTSLFRSSGCPWVLWTLPHVLQHSPYFARWVLAFRTFPLADSSSLYCVFTFSSLSLIPFLLSINLLSNAKSFPRLKLYIWLIPLAWSILSFFLLKPTNCRITILQYILDRDQVYLMSFDDNFVFLLWAILGFVLRKTSRIIFFIFILIYNCILSKE